MKKYISYLGIELQVNDIVKFKTSNMMLIGTIDEFKDDKAIVSVKSCEYKTIEELEMIKSKVKRKYKVNPARCIKCIKKVA